MHTLLYDLRDTWRGLLRDRLYAAAVIGTLGLTLGASMAVFSIVNGVLLRPLAYPDPEALISIREIAPGVSDRYASLPVTLRHFEVWRDRATSFSSMAATDWRTATLTGAGDASQIVVLRASGTLFETLRVPTLLGRGLAREDERLERPRVTVVSERLWRERLGADPAAVGRTVTLNGAPHTIVGVLPRGYALPELEVLGESGTVNADVDAVIPFRVSLANVDWMGMFNYGVIARLKPGVTLDEARAEMAVLQGAVAAIVRQETGDAVELRAWMMPLEETIAGPVRQGLWLLAGAMAAVLLIACANLANLTLTRTLGRLRETAVRGALGASRWRLVRGVIVDQVALALIGGFLGVGIAAWALRLFVTTAPVDLPRVQEVAIDARVLAAGAAVTLLAALLVAVLPAWRIGRRDLESILRGGGRSSDRGAERVRGMLLTAQVGLSVILLVVGGLFVSSLARLVTVDTGFSPEGAVSVEIAPASSRYPSVAARASLYDRIAERVRSLPGVAAASWTSALPLTGETWVDRVVRQDVPDPESTASSANYRFVGPDYFRAIGMPLLSGREFADADRTAAIPPAVVNARVARTLWPGEEALGRIFARGNPSERFQVVGIVSDGRVTALDSDVPLMAYVPYWFKNEGKSMLVVRAREPLGLVTPVRSIVREIDPDVAIARVAPLEHVREAAIASRQYQASLFSVFGASALLLAALGVYATTAYGVSRRRRELNIRVALGAQISQVFSLVLRQSVVPLALGLAGGLAGALALGHLVSSLLYEVRPRDPLVFGTVLVTVMLVGTAAAAIATRSGLRIDPASALRDE